MFEQSGNSKHGFWRLASSLRNFADLLNPYSQQDENKNKGKKKKKRQTQFWSNNFGFCSPAG